MSITRELNADQETVFKAWTDPEMLKKWFGPKGVETRDAQIDLRVGGTYQLAMKEPNGNIINHGGEYREIDPPQKLAFTWVLEDQGCEGSEGLFASI